MCSLFSEPIVKRNKWFISKAYVMRKKLIFQSKHETATLQIGFISKLSVSSH